MFCTADSFIKLSKDILLRMFSTESTISFLLSIVSESKCFDKSFKVL